MKQPEFPRDLLVVTPENIDAVQWRKVLAADGWHTYFAETSDEAFDCLKSGLPSACVLDLPASTALELIRLIYQETLPVIILVTDEELLNHIRNKSTVIPKPLSPSSVLEVLRKQG